MDDQWTPEKHGEAVGDLVNIHIAGKEFSEWYRENGSTEEDADWDAFYSGWKLAIKHVLNLQYGPTK